MELVIHSWGYDYIIINLGYIYKDLKMTLKSKSDYSNKIPNAYLCGKC